LSFLGQNPVEIRPKSGQNPVKILPKSCQNPAKIMSKSCFLSTVFGPFKGGLLRGAALERGYEEMLVAAAS